MFFSIVIAIFNRKDELLELLNSLKDQTYKNFEIIIIDDGSKEILEPLTHDFKDYLDIKYYKKENSGPGLSRNFGVKFAKYDYIIFLDSDCIIPEKYLENVKNNWENNNVDAFGGFDSAGQSFNNLQKSISYSMTSLFTTGGIRGSKKSTIKFQPRSFNMGIKKKVFDYLGGFSDMRIGEDPDLSMNLWENNFKTDFFSSAGVLHKRRTSLKKFSKQVYQFGVARPILNQRHPKYVKITFWFPSLFLLGTIFSFVSAFIYLFSNNLFGILLIFPFIFLILYLVLIFIDSSCKNNNVKIGFLSIITSFIQLFSYGFGFLESYIKLNIFNINPKKAFPNHFY